MSQCAHEWKTLLKTFDEVFTTTSLVITCTKCGLTMKYQLDGKEVK